MVDLSSDHLNPIIKIIQQQKNQDFFIDAANEVSDLIKDCIR